MASRLARVVPWLVLAAAASLAVVKLLRLPGVWVGLIWAAALLAVLVTAIRSYLRGPSRTVAALAVDRHYGQQGQVPAAWEILQRPEAPTGYEQLALERLSGLERFRGGEVAPLQPSRQVPLIGAMLACLVALTFVSVPEPRVTPTVPDPKPEPSSQQLLTQDTAELALREADELERDMSSEAGSEQAARFNEIVERVVRGELTEQQAFRLLAGLEQDVEAAAREAKRFQEGLEKRGEALSGHSISEQLGRALEDGRTKDAQEALERLAERLQSGDQSLSDEEMEQLRQALEETRQVQETPSSQAERQAREAESKRLKDKRDRLLDKKRKGQASAAELSELEQTERRLEQLSRNKSESEEALSELDKQLAEAARELAQEQKKSGQFLDQAARSLERGQKRQLSDEDKKKLIEQLKKLKERLQEQREQGDQAQRLQKFQDRARGRKPGQGQGQGPGQGPPRMGVMPVPVPGGPGPGQPSAGSGQPGDGPPGSQPGNGQEAGHGHDPNLTGDPEQPLGAEAEDAAAVAQDTGEGQSASETILTAAEEGFSRASYRKLYRDYETVAEEVLDDEHIPPGHKRHVERYFELIRPRSGE